MEPDILRDIDRTREPGAIVELPIQSSVKYRRILHRVGQSGLVLPKIHPLGVRPVIDDAKLNAKKPARRGSGNIQINDPVAESPAEQKAGSGRKPPSYKR